MSEEGYAKFSLEDEDESLDEIIDNLTPGIEIRDRDKNGIDEPYFVVDHQYHEDVVDYLQDEGIEYYPAFREEL